jgi:hypothetical protein
MMQGLAERQGLFDESSNHRSSEDISEDCLRMRKLPATSRSKMASVMQPHNAHLPKLHDGAPSHVSKKPDSITISQLMPVSHENEKEESRHPSLSSQMRLFELLQEGSKTFTELMDESGLSHEVLNHFVRIGILAETWGRDGVGLSLTLTSKGVKQLKEFKDANLDNARYSRKSLISLKTRIGP